MGAGSTWMELMWSWQVGYRGAWSNGGKNAEGAWKMNVGPVGSAEPGSIPSCPCLWPWLGAMEVASPLGDREKGALGMRAHG